MKNIMLYIRLCFRSMVFLPFSINLYFLIMREDVEKKKKAFLRCKEYSCTLRLKRL